MIRYSDELMAAPTTFNVRAKLDSYNEGHRLVVKLLKDSNGDRFDDLVYIANNSTLASCAWYAGMLAALFPVNAVYYIPLMND